MPAFGLASFIAKTGTAGAETQCNIKEAGLYLVIAKLLYRTRYFRRKALLPRLSYYSFFFLYCRIASTILTLEIALEQFLTVQESEYLQGLLSA